MENIERKVAEMRARGESDEAIARRVDEMVTSENKKYWMVNHPFDFFLRVV